MIDSNGDIYNLLKSVSDENPLIIPSELAEIVIDRLSLSDEILINYTYIEAMNVLSYRAYIDASLEDKILLIPHCLRDAEKCIAPVDDEGYHCQRCGACIIADIVAKAEEVAIKWFVVGGGSQAMNIVKTIRPSAVLGIACFDEAFDALTKFNEYRIPSIAILLSKAGCVNTEVDINLVVNQLNKIGE